MIFTPANRVFCIMERGFHRHRSGRGGGTCSLSHLLFCCVSEIARLSIIIPTVSSLARSRSRFFLSLSLSLFLSLSLSLYSLLNAVAINRCFPLKRLSVDDRRCEEEVLFSYAKEGAAKCQMPNNGSKQKKTKKKKSQTQTQKTKQNKNKNSQSREERGMKPTSDRSERSVSP